jgi:hypothetical protein
MDGNIFYHVLLNEYSHRLDVQRPCGMSEHQYLNHMHTLREHCDVYVEPWLRRQSSIPMASLDDHLNGIAGVFMFTLFVMGCHNTTMPIVTRATIEDLIHPDPFDAIES